MKYLWIVIGVLLVAGAAAGIYWYHGYLETHSNIYVDFKQGEIGKFNSLELSGYTVTIRGKTVTKMFAEGEGPRWTGKKYCVAAISLRGKMLKFTKDIECIQLHFTLHRDFHKYIVFKYQRNDMFTVDATGIIRNTRSGNNTFAFKVTETFHVGCADSIQLYVADTGKLIKTFGSTKEPGWFGIWDNELATRKPPRAHPFKDMIQKINPVHMIGTYLYDIIF